jgi:hydroxyacylglutathione hydrolase
MRVEKLILTDYQSNCYLVESHREVLILDPGEPSTEIVSKVMGQKVKYIVNTHAHPDHIGGDESLKEHLHAPLLLHSEDLALFQALLGDALTPDRLLSEGDTLELGELQLEVWHTPGHTPGSITLLERRERALFTGDLLFAGSVGRTDFPGGSDIKMRKSLQRVAKLEGDWHIYPGHGPQTSLNQERWTNPFLVGFG